MITKRATYMVGVLKDDIKYMPQREYCVFIRTNDLKEAQKILEKYHEQT